MSRFAVFTIAGEEFGIGIEKIVEIVKMQQATPLPKVPDFISGVINLKGDVIPLMDLRKRLNVKTAPAKERIIITKMHNGKIGLLIDDVKEIVEINEDQISRPPAIFKGLKPEYIRGIGKIPDRLVIILNLDNLLSSEEMILLGERKEDLLKEYSGDKEDV